MSESIRTLARLFSCFVLYSNRLAKNKGLERVYYLSREGQFFLDLHRQLAENGSPDLLPAYHIEASRLSTFLASLPDDPTADDFERYLWQYGLPNLRAFVQGTGLAWPDDVSHWLTRFPDLSLHCEQLSDPRSRLAALLEHREFYAAMMGRIKNRRKDLKNYLDTIGVFDCDRCMVVDIGWAGSIEDNLACTFSDINWHGAYLYLRPAAQASPKNSHKSGFLFDGRKAENFAQDRAMRFVKPLEMLTTPLGGSTIGYLRGKDGEIKPHKSLGPEEQSIKDYWVPIQQAVLNTLATQTLDTSIGDQERDLLTQQLKELLHYPCKQIARAYLTTPREEEFGIGKTYAVIPNETSEPGQSRFLERLRVSSWPHAIIVTALSPCWLVYLSLQVFDFADGVRSRIYRLVYKDYRGILKQR